MSVSGVSGGGGLWDADRPRVESYFTRLEELYREHAKKMSEELAVEAAIEEFSREIENAERVRERARDIAIDRLRRKHDTSRVQAVEEAGATGLDPRPQDGHTDLYA